MRVKVATTPLAIVVALTPVSRQVKLPSAPPHSSDLEALVALGPASTVIAVKSAVEKAKVH